MKAAVFNTDGTGGFVDYEEETLASLIRETVNGSFESIWLRDLGVTMWIHDEGKILNLDLNPYASTLWAAEFGPTDVIVGNMLLTGPLSREGEALSLPDDFVKLLESALHAPEDCPCGGDH